VTGRYADVLPDPIDISELATIVRTHCWMLFLVPNTGENLEVAIRALESMDAMTWAMNADDPMRIFAFVSKRRRMPRALLPYLVMEHVPSS
jgi:hypothetical protein